MKVGIMQPYFFPYIGYFSLIKNVDKFILLDEVQFIRHGWIERNRILKPQGGWQYISVPLKKHSQKEAIKNIKINNTIEWKKKIFAQLVHYKWAMNYGEIIKLMEQIFENEIDDITHLNLQCLNGICKYLEINTPIHIFSEMNMQIEHVNAADEWALNICKKMPDVTEYWNPPGGKSFFDVEKYKENNIKVHFQQMKDVKYKQGRLEKFEPWLSIIDILMFNDKTNILNMLEQYDFV